MRIPFEVSPFAGRKFGEEDYGFVTSLFCPGPRLSEFHQDLLQAMVNIKS